MASLSTGHGRHLIATHRALTKQLEEIERAAVQGRSPGAGGQSLTPLPPELWEQIGAALQRIEALSQTLAKRNAPESWQETETRQPLATTLHWTSLLLRRLEEPLEDLAPEAITRKFGPFPTPGEAEQIKTDVAAMQAELEAAQEALEAWRKK